MLFCNRDRTTTDYEEMYSNHIYIHLNVRSELRLPEGASTGFTMSTNRHDSRRPARVSETKANHDEGLAEIMRLMEYLGDARRAAIALVEKHGVTRSLELLDGLIAECGQNDNPHAVEMGAMWIMVRDHVIDGYDPAPEPKMSPPERE
jgi:hypothetical protein